MKKAEAGLCSVKLSPSFSESMWSWTEFNTELVSAPGSWDAASETKPSVKKACVSVA